MRKRKYLRVASLALSVAAAVGLASVATGAVTSQTAEWNATPSPGKQDKKQRAASRWALRRNRPTTTTRRRRLTPVRHVEDATVHFDKDMSFSAGTLPTCTKAQINTDHRDRDRQGGLPRSLRSERGSASLNGAAGPVEAVVTAFNGAPQNGVRSFCCTLSRVRH